MSTPETPARTVIEASRSWRPRLLSEVYAYRDLLLTLLRRDVSLRYRQTLLGPAWVVLQPLLGAGVFSFVFGSVAKVHLPVKVPYFIFTLVGMGLWTGFSSAVGRGTTSTIASIDLITKIYFPRIILPVSVTLSTTFDASLMLGIVLVVLVLTGHGLPLLALLVPALLLGCQLTALGIASALGAVLVRFRDVGYAVPILVQSLLFVTPVLYPLQSVPTRLRPIVTANPLTFYFETLRWALFGSAAPSPGLAVYGVSMSVALVAVGLSVFTRLQHSFADVI